MNGSWTDLGPKPGSLAKTKRSITTHKDGYESLEKGHYALFLGTFLDETSPLHKDVPN